jgi:hypothetical protein
MLNPESVEAQLTDLGIALNSTLIKTIAAASEQTVIDAIAALKEAMAVSEINRPGGWLKRAIDGQWKPNRKASPQSLMSQFNEWFELARKQGLVIASMKQSDGQILVFDQQGKSHLFGDMVKLYPLAAFSHSTPANTL